MAQHELHRHAERRVAPLGADVERFHMVEQSGTAIPGHGGGATHHIVAGQRRDRNGDDVGEVEALRQLAKLCLDGTESGFRIADQIHLVDGEHHVPDTDKMANGGVAARLALHSMARIDEQDRDVGVRGASRHVAGILLVPGRIDDDEAALPGLEIAPGDVDGNTLLALSLKAVEQQAEIDLVAVLQAILRGVYDCRALVLGDRGCIPQHPADQRRFAVVDRAAGEQPHDSAARGSRRG